MAKVKCNKNQIEELNILLEVPKLADKYNVNKTLAWGLFNGTPNCLLDSSRLSMVEQQLKSLRE